MAVPEKSLLTLFLRLLALTVYILLGSLVFSYIELKQTSVGDPNSRIIYGTISFLLQNHSCTHNLSETELHALTQRYMEHMEGGKERWQFKDGLQFSFEFLTTIGYGTTPPMTQTGRLLSIFCVLFGIPLSLLVLKGLGELINDAITKAIMTFEKRVLKREQPPIIKWKVLYVFAVGMVVFIALVAIKIYTFPKYGSPTYIDALYVLFTTFATVGFGDITFVDSTVNVPVALLGLTLVSTTINAISVWLESREQESNLCLKCCRGNKTANQTEIIHDSGAEGTER